MVASFIQSQVPPIARPTLNTLKKKLGPLFPDDIRVECVCSVEGHVHPINHAKLSDGQHIIFKATPYQTTTLLRREYRSLEAEIRVLTLLKPQRDSLIPLLIEPDSQPLPHSPPLLVRHFVRGVPLPEIESSLRPSQWDGIYRNLGNLVYLISQQRSGSFGPVASVSSGSGCSTWQIAFITLIESALRDAEDMFISLQYTQIRQEIYRLVPALDSVTQPRLVVVDMGKKSHIIMDPETKQISGVVDFSWAVWGDPLMAEVFENPSPAFFRGYGSTHPRDKSEHIRLLLCYRHLCRIVEQFYRYQNQDEELRARKKLITTLTEMTATTFDETGR
ncbi:hypothetical protein FQN54_007227 [Arachnomyces sp. PD_36]|nr:hypothetical protein FQN54_007227 [Arachnomyces sp. PD_36]